MQLIKSHKSFGGQVQFWEHPSQETGTTMRFASFRPERAPRACLIWLSGLTCTEENFVMKAGAQRALAEAGLLLICPDTSPRGLDLPNEHTSWDFGSGAGFYVDATTTGYRDHYRMYSYVTKELYSLIEVEFAMQGRISIFGHSMGGHGALIMGLREPAKFRSVSAFAPIAHPIGCPWGQKALEAYLGADRVPWRAYDACALLEDGRRHPKPLLIDQGTADPFLKEQLLPERLSLACEQFGQELRLRYQEGYDHSYYGIATFIEDHIAFHAEALSSSR